MAIPGRVGYQCSNFYRQLLEKHEIIDPNYYIDDKGKAHYLFGSKKDKDGAPLAPELLEARRREAIRSRKPKAKKRKRYTGSESDEEDYDVDDEDDSGTFHCGSWNTTKRTRGRNTSDSQAEEDSSAADEARLANPLPGFVDPITLEEVVKPAISPYGHVMRFVFYSSLNLPTLT